MKMRWYLVPIIAVLTCADAAPAQSLKDRLKKAAEKVEKTAEDAAKKGEKAGAKANQLAATAGVLLPISTAKEIDIGRGIAATVAGRYALSTNDALNEYVTLVGLVVAEEGARPDIVYRFAVLETPDVNAFASPGGYIFVTRGALDLIESEAELAGVLGHEVAHVNRRHVIEQIRKADIMREVKEESGIDGEKLDKVVGAGADVLFTGLSREDEAAADSLGVEYAASAGYAADGLTTFVAKLAKHTKEGRLAELMSTHPKPEDRIARLTRIAERSGASGVTLAVRYREFVSRVVGVAGAPPWLVVAQCARTV